MIIIRMVLAGIGFKMATVPFHFWCPDVYTGAPTPVTAFLSVGPKVAGFAVLVRFFYGGLARPEGEGVWSPSSP
jgi:NADH-quinone oxidoreductase subunit N